MRLSLVGRVVGAITVTALQLGCPIPDDYPPLEDSAVSDSGGSDATLPDAAQTDTAPDTKDAASTEVDTPDMDSAPTSIDVNGRTTNDGLVAPNVTLTITDARGVDKVVTSDAAGVFTVKDVLPPYDIYLVAEAAVNVLYQGLSSKTPVLPRSKSGPQEYEEDVGVDLAPAVPAQPYSATTTIALATTRKSISGAAVERIGFYPGGSSGTYGPGDGCNINYTHSPTVPEVTFDLHFLRATYSGTPPVPLSYDGYATVSDLVFKKGTSLAIPALTVTDPSDNWIGGGGYTPPPGLLPFARRIYLAKGPRTSIEVFNSLAGGDSVTAFDFAIPGIAGFTVAVCGQAGLGSADLASSSACKASVVASPALILLAPTEGKSPSQDSVTAGPRGPFAFDHSESKQAYVLDVRPDPYSSATPTWVVYTSSRSVTLPSSRPGLAPKTRYAWTVSSVAPFESIDDFLTEDQLFTPHDRDRYETKSKRVTFTTAL